MKKQFFRIISCLLVLSITVTTLPFSSVISSFAEETGEDLWDGEDRATEEAKKTQEERA